MIRKNPLALLLPLVPFFTLGCERNAPSSTSSQGGPHGRDPVPADTEGNGHQAGLEPVSITLFTEKVELFMEYPRLVVGETAKCLAHFTVLATGEPVRSGTLTLAADSAGGQPVRVTIPAPKRDGLFTPEATFAAAGTYKARLILESEQVTETVDLGELKVYGTRDEAQRAADADPGEDPPNAVPFLMEQQWKIAMRMEQATRRTLVKRLHVPAQIEAPSGHAAVAAAPVAGRLHRSPTGGWLRIGDRVQVGQVLAYVEPPMPATEAAQMSANRAQLASLEIDLLIRGTDVQRAIAQARARLDYATRALERAKALRAKGVGTVQEVDEAEQSHELARAEHEGARAMQTQYEQIRKRFDVLRGHEATEQRSDQVTSNQSGGGPLLLPITAPIAGEIVSIAHIEGESVDAQREVFRIMNLQHIWVVGNVSEFDLPTLPASPGALLVCTTAQNGSSARIDILAAGGRLVHVGTVIDTASRSVPIRYELANREDRFRVGELVDLYLETQVRRDAVTVPQDCIVLDNGRPIAFVLVHGELFERRELELGIRDGESVEVKRGIEAGERCAGRGVHAIHLLSMSPARFGAGHVH